MSDKTFTVTVEDTQRPCFLPHLPAHACEPPSTPLALFCRTLRRSLYASPVVLMETKGNRLAGKAVIQAAEERH